MNKLKILLNRIEKKIDQLDDAPELQSRLAGGRRREAVRRLWHKFNHLCGYEDLELDVYIERQRAAKRALYRGDQLYDLVGKPYWIGGDGLHVLGLKPD